MRNYDPIEQYCFLLPYHDPTPPLNVPQGSFDLKYKLLLPNQISSSVSKFLPKNYKRVEFPFDEHSRYLCTSVDLKHSSVAQLNVTIAHHPYAQKTA